MGDAPLQHHHHYISHSQPRSTVPLDAQALCDGGHQAKYATLEQEVQRLQVLSQKPGGIPHFGSELDRGQFLLAHGLTELGFRHWEERYRTQNLQAVINGSSTQEVGCYSCLLKGSPLTLNRTCPFFTRRRCLRHIPKI